MKEILNHNAKNVYCSNSKILVQMELFFFPTVSLL